MKGTSGILLSFCLTWCTGIGYMDAKILGGVVRQSLTRSDQPVKARILVSEIVSETDSDGDESHYAKVVFGYTRGGRSQQSDKLSYNPASSSFEDPEEVVRRYPAGAETTAYVDASQPENAVLQRGLSAIELVTLMALTPFHVVALGLLWVALPGLRRGKTGGVVVRECQRDIRARLQATHPWVTALAYLGGGAFAGIVVVALGSRILPMSWVAPAVWMTILGLTSWSWISARRGNDRGDLVIHKKDDTVVVWPLPLDKPRTLAKQELEKLSLVEETSEDRDGDTLARHILKLHLRDGETLSIRDTNAYDEDLVQPGLFAQWLSQKLGLPLDAGGHTRV